jgi:TatA/E family protein of Tat protein translocase
MNVPFLAFIEGIGGPELLMIMFIVLLLFGADKMPDLARGLGRAVREFKKATSGVEQEVRRAMEEPPPTPSPRPPGTVGQSEVPKKIPPPQAD